MANDIKKYVGPDSLSAILNNIESTYSQKAHMHSIESIKGLQEAVGAAADSKFYVVTFDQGADGEYHGDLTFAEIREKFEAGGNMVARIDGTDYIPLLSAAPHQIIFSGIYQATSVSLTIGSNDVCTLSSTSLARSSHTHPAASSSASGFMSKEDKVKLNGIETGAEVNIIESITVNGEEVPVTNKAVNIEIPEQTQSDWNQNDEAASDYIKDRPFYDNTEVLLDTITVNNGDTLDFGVSSFGNTGDIVSVIWDGVLTNKTIGYCVVKSGRWDLPYSTIGNQSYIAADSFSEGGNDTGEDYVIYSGATESVTTSTIICDDQSHTLSIVKGGLVQIDEKFIPETIAKKTYVDEKVDEVIANIPSVTDVETKMPITLGAFYYYKWGELPGSTVEEKANNLAKYDVIVYQDSLCNDLEMDDPTYERDLALYKKALEYNPDLKVFGYVTARGFATSKSGGHVGMTEYRTSPENVDHPIWTKEELAAYINLMAHCGGTKDDSTTDEFGNPVLTGGIPLYGVFFDDWDYHFNDDNTHIMNQGDWSSIREKHNFLIDYCHSCGLHAMPNSNPTLIFDNTETPNSVRNPNGIPSSMTADDWFCIESYFLRTDKTFSTTDSQVTTYNENYRETYKSKCLALAYVNMVDDDSEDNEQIANTFALYQALCQGADSIVLHGSNCITEIPEEFAKYYDKNNNAIYTSGTGYYKLTVNGHTVTATRNASATNYGQSPNAAAFATCKIIIDDHNVFNNMCVRNEEMLYKFADVNKDIKELNAMVEQSSNLYHRALIDDWKKDFTLADYTNYSFTFQNAFGGEDTGATSSWNSSDPYSAMIYLPKQYSWRRVETNISHLAGKTVELGFENIDVYLSGSPTTKISGITWEVIAVCDSGTVTITKFNASTMQKSVIDGVSRCCAKFTFPEDVQTLRFWTQRQSATPEGTWVIDFADSYLVDINEHPIQKTWFTNYAPASGSWGALGSNSKITYGDDAITVDYTATTQCYEARMQFPANTAIFKPGETWELGFKDIKLTHLGTGADITSKLVILFNLGSQLVNLSISGKSHDAFLNMKSEVSDDRIAIASFTVPADYAGGMAQTPMYVYTNGYVGGDSNGFYQLYIEGLYLYKLDERDELFIRGEDLSDTYIGINRVRTDTIDEKLKPDSLYVVDDGSMFITDFRGDRVDIGGKDGKDGTDGVSATHSWSGTTLTITSASGTSSANLKGDKGDKGDTGSTGTSVTVSNVSESTASGGTNVVTFSDGKKVNIKNGTNGAKGADGKTPVRGTDYWTEEDKAEIVRQVLASMAMPVAGIVDENNNIIITGELPDGAYTLRYEFADGSATNIGTLNISSGPAYTNLADPTSTEWLTNKRINSSKNVVDVTETQRGDKTVVVTNHIDITGVSKLHIKGLDIINNLVNGSSNQNFGRMYAYKDGAVYLSTYQVSSGVSGKTHYTYADYDSSVVILDVAAAFADWGYTNITEISLGGILTGAAEDVIITADENIV